MREVITVKGGKKVRTQKSVSSGPDPPPYTVDCSGLYTGWLDRIKLFLSSPRRTHYADREHIKGEGIERRG